MGEGRGRLEMPDVTQPYIRASFRLLQADWKQMEE